jgi:hypothetical protein
MSSEVMVPFMAQFSFQPSVRAAMGEHRRGARA